MNIVINFLEGAIVILGLLVAVALFAWFYNSEAWQKIAKHKDTLESILIILVIFFFCVLIGSGVDFLR